MTRRSFWWLLPPVVWFAVGARPVQLAVVNAAVLTMDARQPAASAFLVTGRRIGVVGTDAEVLAAAGEGAAVLDLEGRSVLPGFIDAHSHFPATGLTRLGVDLTPPPTGRIASLSAMRAALRDAAAMQPDGDWVLGFNYDDAALDDGSHPSRSALDNAVPDHPVYLRHRSGHMGVANSRALVELGLDESSVPPAGGGFGRDTDGRLDGLLQETAAPSLLTLLREVPIRRLLEVLPDASDDYLRAGVTTVQNGLAGNGMLQGLRWAQVLGLLPQRVVVWPAASRYALDRLPSPTRFQREKRFASSSSFSVGAVKLIVDGSPQGATAWVSQPYDERAGKVADYRGFSLIEAASLATTVHALHQRGFQLAMHGNGDAAIDAILDAVASLHVAMPGAQNDDRRHIIVHAQLMREDQLRRAASLGLSVSFFPTHTWFWGDWYRARILGEARAAHISPLAAADRAGVRYTLHSDAPVTPMRPLQMLFSATERQTLSGFTLGPDERISRQRALEAMTIDAAWQSHLDESLGSISAGKFADFIVLSDHPLEADDVRAITVDEVWIDGRRRYYSGIEKR